MGETERFARIGYLHIKYSLNYKITLEYSKVIIYRDFIKSGNKLYLWWFFIIIFRDLVYSR